jgi:hypothetical protein
MLGGVRRWADLARTAPPRSRCRHPIPDATVAALTTLTRIDNGAVAAHERPVRAARIGLARSSAGERHPARGAPTILDQVAARRLGRTPGCEHLASSLEEKHYVAPWPRSLASPPGTLSAEGSPRAQSGNTQWSSVISGTTVPSAVSPSTSRPGPPMTTSVWTADRLRPASKSSSADRWRQSGSTNG